MIRPRDPLHDTDGDGGVRLPDGRREPTFGEAAGSAPERRRGPRRPPPGNTAPRHWRWLLALALLLVAALLVLRQPLADRLWPQNPAQEALARADVALQRGHLSSADGSGARELYEAALAMDPDRPEPREGLAQVARAALAQARQHAAGGRFHQAHAALRLARELSAPREEVQAVAGLLREREVAGAGLEELLARADRALAAGRLHGSDDAALPLYRLILRLDPDHLDALRGRDDAIGELLQQARASLRAGGLAPAAAATAVAREFDPGHADLPDTEARLIEERDATFARAEADLQAGRLDRAAERFQALVAMDGEDGEARDGRVRTGLAYARRAEALAADLRLAEAQASLALARTLAADDARVRAAGERIGAVRARHARQGPVLAPAVRRARVQALLEDVAAAERRGDLLSPPGESAYDRLQAARAIAPDDPEVRQAGARLLAAAADCFERELRANSLGRANACLDARIALGGDPRVVAAAQRRLAQRWLAIGDERLGAGDLQGAGAALSAAREADPGVPGLAEFSGRLRIASASGR